MNEHTEIKEARQAILTDLKQRYQQGDKTVVPLKPENEHRWYKPQDNYFTGSGVCLCPICNNKTLHYSRANYNGHVHARCETGCVAWME